MANLDPNGKACVPNDAKKPPSNDPKEYHDDDSGGQACKDAFWSGGRAWVDDKLPPPAIDKISDFIAGAGDSLSFGLTRMIRGLLPGGDSTNTCGDAYSAGLWTETAAEVGLSGGSALLKSLAKKAGSTAAKRTLVRAAGGRVAKGAGMVAGAGEEIHHVNPLFGHPGGPALFPTGGLPASIHSGKWNLARMGSRSSHAAAHRAARTMEGVGLSVANPTVTAARAANNWGMECTR